MLETRNSVRLIQHHLTDQEVRSRLTAKKDQLLAFNDSEFEAIVVYQIALMGIHKDHEGDLSDFGLRRSAETNGWLDPSLRSCEHF